MQYGNVSLNFDVVHMSTFYFISVYENNFIFL